MKYSTKIFVGHQRYIEAEINEWLENTHPKHIVSTHASSAIYTDPTGGYSNIITIVVVIRDGMI